MDETLRNCPVCDSSKTTVRYSEEFGYWVECDNCRHEGMYGLTEEEATKGWQKAKYVCLICGGTLTARYKVFRESTMDQNSGDEKLTIQRARFDSTRCQECGEVSEFGLAYEPEELADIDSKKFIDDLYRG